jgi:hypothetical protein
LLVTLRHFENAVKTAAFTHIKNFKSRGQSSVIRTLASDAHHKDVVCNLASDVRHRGIAERTLNVTLELNQEGR